MKKMTLAALLLSSLFTGAAFASDYNLPGFTTEIEDGRLWAFRENSPELEEFKKTGEPAKQYTDIGSGPKGMTVKAADEANLKEYLEAIKQ